MPKNNPPIIFNIHTPKHLCAIISLLKKLILSCKQVPENSGVSVSTASHETTQQEQDLKFRTCQAEYSSSPQDTEIH